MLGNERFDREEIVRVYREAAKDESASHESRKVRPIEEKESFRWLDSLERSTADIPCGVKVITVCDREGDT
ncbi:MAG: hypothetical protein LBD47_03005 [Treponema sp.]|jgi:hypothetical protein|nr:hypothetical protein [Treponema sp.]